MSMMIAPYAFLTLIAVTLDPSNKYSLVTLSNGDLTWHGFNGFGARQKVRATDFVAVGEKKYAEITVDFIRSSQGLVVGVVDSSVNLASDLNTPGSSNYDGLSYDGTQVLYDFSTSDDVADSVATDIIMLAVYRIDSSDVQIFMGLNGTWFNGDDPGTLTGGYTISLANDVYMYGGSANDDQGTYDFGSSAFAYSIPSGFTAMSPE